MPAEKIDREFGQFLDRCGRKTRSWRKMEEREGGDDRRAGERRHIYDQLRVTYLNEYREERGLHSADSESRGKGFSLTRRSLFKVS